MALDPAVRACLKETIGPELAVDMTFSGNSTRVTGIPEGKTHKKIPFSNKKHIISAIKCNNEFLLNIF